MVSLDSGNHPFKYPIIRYFIAWMFGLSLLFLGIVYLVAGGFDQLSDLGLETIIQLLSFLPIIWFIGYHVQRKLSFQYFLGREENPYSWLQLFGLWLLIFMFGYGADGLFTYGLSYLAPQYVAETLRITVISTEYSFLFNVFLVLIVAFITPVMEELVFRGLLLHRIAIKRGIHFSVIVTSLCFGLLHGEGWIGSGMFGVCMCLIYLKTNNLSIPILIHIFNNLVAVGIIFLSNQVEEVQDLGTMRADLWFFVVALVISAPILYNFVRKSWPDERIPLPYLKHLNYQT